MCNCDKCGRQMTEELNEIVHYDCRDCAVENEKYLSSERRVLKEENNKLLEELAALKEKLRWIPVSERLPENDGRYECKVHFGKFHDEYDNDVELLEFAIEEYLGELQTEFRDNEYRDFTAKVTHWRKVPEL